MAQGHGNEGNRPAIVRLSTMCVASWHAETPRPSVRAGTQVTPSLNLTTTSLFPVASFLDNGKPCRCKLQSDLPPVSFFPSSSRRCLHAGLLPGLHRHQPRRPLPP